MRLALLAVYVSFLAWANAFGSKSAHPRVAAGVRGVVTRLDAVTEVTSSSALDSIVSDAGEGLVVVDYSTTWCGPCKMVLPQYIELSDKYPGVKFLKCIGDSSADASALMKREGVRSVPSFHFWKGGIKIDSINGARIDDVESIIKSSA